MLLSFLKEQISFCTFPVPEMHCDTEIIPSAYPFICCTGQPVLQYDLTVHLKLDLKKMASKVWCLRVKADYLQKSGKVCVPAVLLLLIPDVAHTELAEHTGRCANN